jgi:SAM-dependent methyltransferase
MLDVGCWGGASLERMSAHNMFRELHGVDLLESSVQAARARGMKAEVVDLNQQSLPYDEGFFDAVTCLAVIAQLFDPGWALFEIRRVLRPSGQLILSVPNVACLPNRLKLLVGRRPRTSPDPGWDGGQLNYFTLSHTRKLLEQTGFEVRAVYAVGRWSRLRGAWPALLSRDLVFDATRSA